MDRNAGSAAVCKTVKRDELYITVPASVVV